MLYSRHFTCTTFAVLVASARAWAPLRLSNTGRSPNHVINMVVSPESSSYTDSLSKKDSARRHMHPVGKSIVELGNSIGKYQLENMKHSEPAERGLLWVAPQLALMASVMLGAVPFVTDSPLFLPSMLAFTTGTALIVSGISSQGHNMTPYVTPVKGAPLKTKGGYEVVRHPIYGGLLLSCVGFSGLTDSATRLVLTAALWAVLRSKASEEEGRMRDIHGSAFDKYAEEVPWAFVPYIKDEEMSQRPIKSRNK